MGPRFDIESGEVPFTTITDIQLQTQKNEALGLFLWGENLQIAVDSLSFNIESEKSARWILFSLNIDFQPQKPKKRSLDLFERKNSGMTSRRLKLINTRSRGL